MAQEDIYARGIMHINTTLQEVLKTTLIHNGLAHGIHEANKALDKCQAHLCTHFNEAQFENNHPILCCLLDPVSR